MTFVTRVLRGRERMNKQGTSDKIDSIGMLTLRSKQSRRDGKMIENDK